MMHYLFNESTTVISRNLYDLSDKNTVDQSSINKAFQGLETIIHYFYQFYCLYPQKVFRLPLAEELIIREAIHELSQLEALAANNNEEKRVKHQAKIAWLRAALDCLVGDNESIPIISRNLYDLSDKNPVDQSSITKAFKDLETIILYFYQLYCLYPQKVFRLPRAEELIIRKAIHKLSQCEASAVNNNDKKRIEYHTKIALLNAALDQLASNNASAIKGYKLILEKRPGWGAVYFFLLPLLEKLNLVDEYKEFREKMINNALVEENYHNHPSKDFLAKAYHEIFREEEIIQRKLALENKKKSELTSATSSNIRPSNMDEKEIQKENSDLGRSTFCKKEGGDNEGVFRLKLKI